MIQMPEVFLDAYEPLKPTNAVAALLVIKQRRVIMQLRDLKSSIFYPGHWGLFGGAIDVGEDEDEALRRELQEELGFVPRELNRFARLDFDLTGFGGGKVFRAVYEVPVTEREFEAFDLNEGRACQAFDVRQVLTELLVTPYDSFAVWLYHARSRLIERPVGVATREVPGDGK